MVHCRGADAVKTTLGTKGEKGGKGRSLRRIWLAREGLQTLSNAAGQSPEKRALKRYESYRILGTSESCALPLSLGIIRLRDVDCDHAAGVARHQGTA